MKNTVENGVLTKQEVKNAVEAILQEHKNLSHDDDIKEWNAFLIYREHISQAHTPDDIEGVEGCGTCDSFDWNAIERTLHYFAHEVEKKLRPIYEKRVAKS